MIKLYSLFTTKISLYLCFFFIGLTSIAQGTLAVTSNGNSVLTGSANSPAGNNNTDFGNVEVGSNKANTFVLDNTVSGGNTADELTGITVIISGSGSSNFTPNNSVLGNLKGNATPLNHIITFTPNSPGIKTATVTITFTKGTNSPYTFTIQGNGITPTPEVEITDNGNAIINNGGNFNFGTIIPNSTTTETFKIKNTSNASTTLNLTGSPSVDIIGDSEFTITAQPSGTSIIGGNFLSFTVKYHPLALGSHSATISIGNDDPDGSENPYIITMQGTADNITYTPITDGPDWTVTNITPDFELNSPNTIVYGPDNYLWITERYGLKVVKVDPNLGGSKTVMLDLAGIATVASTSSQDGLMGLAIHPDLYADVTTTTNNFVYLVYTYNSGGLKLRIARYNYVHNGGNGYLDSATATTILEGLDASNDHNSGKLIFGPDMKLYYTAGDLGANQYSNACQTIQAQTLPSSGGQTPTTGDKSAYKGKILRMNLDGSIPVDNPILGSFRTHVYSFGHRNPQGIVFGSNGNLYSSEHGPKTDDELNIIQSGKNYGWPAIAGYYDGFAYEYCDWSSSSSCNFFSENGCPGDVTPIPESDPSNDVILPDFMPPIGTYNSTVISNPGGGFFAWPTVAPSSIAIYEAGLIPDWGSSLLIPTLKRGTIFRAKLNVAGDGLESQTYEEFHSSNDRYRDVVVGPDGVTFYAITDATGSTSGPSGTTPQAIENPGVVVKIQYTGITLNNNAIEKSAFKFNLVPNPATDNFKLNFNASLINSAELNMQIIDMQGRNVKQLKNISNNTIISTSSFSNGLYFVKIQDESNKVIGIKKLIVKH